MVRKTGVFLSKQRAKPNRTPQHTPGHSAHPEIARSSPPCATRLSSAGARVSAGGGGTVRCSPILPKAPAITDIHRDLNPPRRTDPESDGCGSAKAPGSLRLVWRHGGAPAAQGVCNASNSIQGQHPLCPLNPLSSLDPPLVGREKRAGAPDRCSSPEKDQRKTWGPWPTAASSVAQSSPRHGELTSHASRGERSNGEQKAWR